ncbi:unnamed protein product [Clonostachys chloroleuca]|uniref:Uncharacterized protein n=1 Tax=Clonostachys chloroleuca TaxID=1926264 RepID=A0AA35LZ17_9HYPO|nr:unnamed protein product [Clonostachys chloroleuca]
MAPFSALLTAELPIFKADNVSAGDDVSHHKVDQDTALVARQLAFINFMTVMAVLLVLAFSSESIPGLERLLALLDIALTVAWACVCWIPLELNSHYACQGSDDDVMITSNIGCRRAMWTPGLHTILEVAESK